MVETMASMSAGMTARTVASSRAAGFKARADLLATRELSQRADLKDAREDLDDDGVKRARAALKIIYEQRDLLQEEMAQ
jgi:hypothetical protein